MPSSSPRLSRRRFLHHSAALAAGSVVVANCGAGLTARAAEAGAGFRSEWDRCHDRIWLGPEYWANPLQDWQLAGGRIETTFAGPDRNVHLLTRQLGERRGTLEMTVRVGRVERGSLASGRGSFGFRIGISGPLREYRHSLFYGRGLDVGVTAAGVIFVGNPAAAGTARVDLNRDSVDLRLTAEPAGDNYKVTLTVLDARTSQPIGQASSDGIAASQLVGNVALVANFGAPGAPGAAKAKAKAKAKGTGEEGSGVDNFWFADWRVAGTKFEAHEDHAFGPILFSSYTLSGGVMKMTAQMPPIGAQESPTVRLETKAGANWKTIGEEKIHPDARTATFRVAKWEDQKHVEYRLAYTQKFKTGSARENHWTGTIRRDPVDQPVLTVADISCNIHSAFPNHPYVANAAKVNPDLLAFVGDQFYESTAGYGVVRSPLDRACLDYLRKWYAHGWTWRELTRDRPSVSLPDDHDVYQGNLWGEAGEGRKTTQEAGGYDLPAAWVNVVHRTQASHHPDAYDPTPGLRGTSNYYGSMVYGRVSFAILADRQYKSGPEGKVPPTGGRGDHVKDPEYDPKTGDVPGLQLLGDRQMAFLREWAADWRGAEMKAVVSQTIFTAMATTHGGHEGILIADYDANGWPQSQRNAVLRELRRAFAFHLAGDQHLPALVHYGVEEHRDAGVAFAGPAVNVGYQRWWEPGRTRRNRKTGNTALTGDFHDHFGHPLTVLAVKNPPERLQSTQLLEVVNEKTSGLGVVRFDKARRKIIIECWPYLADPTQPGTQFPGWPVTIDVLENYARKPAAHLPLLNITGLKNPVVQVFEEAKNELVYGLRLAGQSFRPHVFAEGKYTVRVSEPESGRTKEVKGLQTGAGGVVEIKV